MRQLVYQVCHTRYHVSLYREWGNPLCALNIQFFNYVFSGKEYETFSYGLDQHVTTFANYNAIEIEFE